MKRSKRPASFDFEIEIRGHRLRVTGNMSPYVPATGPSMENAGGDPAEGGDIEDLEVVMVRHRKDGNIREREVDTCGLQDETVSAIEDAISEKLSEYEEDRDA